MKWNYEPFEIPSDILKEWREIGTKGEKLEKEWRENLIKKPKLKTELENIYIKSNIEDLRKLIQKEKSKYQELKPSLATRQCSSKTIESVTSILPQLIGGSADLSGSNNTKTTNSNAISSKNFKGNYLHYGVREHGMAAIMNGLALYSGLIPFGGTFLIFLIIVNLQLDFLH